MPKLWITSGERGLTAFQTSPAGPSSRRGRRSCRGTPVRVATSKAISLTLRRRKDSRYLNPSEQVKARKADRLMVNITGGPNLTLREVDEAVSMAQSAAYGTPRPPLRRRI